ncbi:MAG: hypothetical protein IJW21_08120, partial [Clostridia bacterium]|nr:hypothetical protein [Clostridia bacterium]
MGYNDKESGAFDITANEMLRRLNNQYKADKFAGKYTENAEYVKAEDGSIQIDISTLSDEEFKVLFDSYLETSKMNVNMTESTYKSLQYHIANLQQKSGAMLVTEDEMEKRFADAEIAKKALAEAEEEEEHFPLSESPVSEHKILAFDEEEETEVPPAKEICREEAEEEGFGATTTELIQPEQKAEAEEAEEEAEAEVKEEITEAEALKNRRMSIFARLKALMHEEEPEQEPKHAEEEFPVYNEDFQNTDMMNLPEDEEEEAEGLTEEFVSPFTAEREAVAASEMMETAVFSSTFENIECDEDDTPTETMIENYVEDTAMLPAYEPKIAVAEAEEISAEAEAEEAEEVIPPASEEFEAPLEIPEEEEEVPTEIIPEEPAEAEEAEEESIDPE